MSNQNKAQKQMIVDIKDTFFEIPAYQRLYEWGKEQIETLLDDMKKAYGESKEQYFIGNITTSIGKDDSNKFVLIDGQQRLTTLWFIGFYLASRECEWETKDKKVWQNFILQNDNLRISMPIRDNEEKALKDLANNIAGKENLAQSLLGKDIYQNIFDAFKCIESWFVSGNGKDIDLANFAKYIYESVCFVFVELAQNTDLNSFFVRMNNRGKQLEKHEILKARILDKIKDDKSDEWQKYAKIWDLCSDMNKYIFQSASDRNFLNSENESDEKCGIDTIISEFSERSAKGVQNDDTPDKVESIIDFPTFLLHCLKLYAHNNSKNDISISKDNLLDIFDLDNGEKWDNKSCKCFITDMLYYRVLFDYFVIKSDVVAKGGNSYKIMRLYESKDNYSLPENSKKGELTSGVLHDLVMIQNYLRVARQGDRQNYHHWLTPFLAYLDTQKDKILVFEKSVLDLDFAKWKTEKDGNKTAECEDKTTLIAKRFSESNDENLQNDLISYLSKLDTALSKEQLGTNGENKLLLIANEAIQATFKAKSLNDDINWNFKSITDKWKQYTTKDNYKEWAFLKNGTGTPHYWFYRLEYYLWKNGVANEEILKIRGKSFGKIRKNFYFRNLGSIEHFQPQSEPDEKWWLNDKSEMDTFGNLALISRSLNSSLGKQNLDKKEIDIAKDSNSESLKLVLMCCLKNNNNAENGANSKAQAHQEQMIDILIESLKSSQ